MGYPSASQRSDHGVSYKGLTPSEEILILEARGRGKKPNTHLHGFCYRSYHLTVTKATQPPGTGCWPRESVLPAAWGPRSWQLRGGVEGLRVRRASWKAQVPVFLKIVGIPIDRNAGRGRKVKAVCPCICQIYQLSCGSFEQLDKMKSGALLWISNPRDRCDTHPFGQPVLSLFQAHFWFCQLYSCITMPQNQPLPWFRLRPKKQE